MTKKTSKQQPAGDPLWYKDAIIYQLHVKAFYDSNGNGIGDFRGLTEKLDYIQGLGVNTVWLLPFYPSPLRDDGYDISGYTGVHGDYGDMRDFRRFIRAAHQRGLRVITELVINHTSDQHPWFQAARAAPAGSAKRNFYVWSDSDRRYPETRIIFTDTETSNWAWDPVAQQYYWHRFFSHQPDLNFDNPKVFDAVVRVMKFWLDAGVDGLRLDAIPYLCERDGTNNENLPETHAVLRRLRAELDAGYSGRMLLAEANQWPEDVLPYFGNSDECHVAFHFPLMPRIYMAVAQEDRHPIVEILEQTPEIPETCQWAIFLRNHDELTLEMVTDSERDYLYNVYASDPRMRVNIGIRRRLAPLMENDIDKIKLMNNLLLSMPGSPVIYYGDEIGMGDNIYAGDRHGVRTPMQWSPDRNAGFSTADPARLHLPPIMDAVYGYEALNVEGQSRNPSSLLSWMKRIIAIRSSYHAFGRGTLKFLRPGNRKILAYLREFGGDTILCVTNLSRFAQPVELDLSAYKGRVPVEMMGRVSFPPIGDLPYLMTLSGYGFYWFRLATDATVPAWHEESLPPLELPMVVLFAGWETIFPEKVGQRVPAQRGMAQNLRARLEREIFPKYIYPQRWYAGNRERIDQADFADHGEWLINNGSWQIALVSVHSAHHGAELYFMPLALAWDDQGEDHVRSLLPRAMARIRRGARVGVMFDAFSDEAFCRGMVTAMGQNQDSELENGSVAFRSTGHYRNLSKLDISTMPVRPLGIEQSNTSVVIGDQLILKGYRHLHRGINPEVEIGHFLTDISPFRHIAPVTGYVAYHAGNGDISTLAVLQKYIGNQGDGWSYTAQYLEHYIEDYRVHLADDQRPQVEARQAIYMTLMRQLGLRVGELHHAFSQATGTPAFDPEPVTGDELSTWWRKVRADVVLTLNRLEKMRATLAESAQPDITLVLGMQETLTRLIGAGPPQGLQVEKSRYHGDFSLARVLVVENDLVIINFEGDLQRTLEERRRKHSPLRDVASMLYSFMHAVDTAVNHIATEDAEDYADIRKCARDQGREIILLFLQGYADAATGCPTYPSDPEHAQWLLNLFIVERALYMLRRDLDSHPARVECSLRCIAALAEQSLPRIGE